MTICNACRYCEGFCAVFPAMELRRTFTQQDLKYLANLCHNCRGCYYACQYAPPHPFEVNIPKTLGELRLDTYKEFAWPKALGALLERNHLWVSAIIGACIALVLFFTLLFQGQKIFWTAFSGPGAFYEIVSYPAMVATASLAGLFALFSLIKGWLNAWKAMGAHPRDLRNPAAHLLAMWDVLRLRYLDGGGEGCNYPDDRFRMIRPYFHHCVFYGFFSCLAATTIAAFYDHFLHQPAPYPLLSWPVFLGTAGGLSMMTGCAGLLWLKTKMDTAPAVGRFLGMDVVFLVSLFLANFTGLMLLIFRETPLMGLLLTVHLGLVLGLFITFPYGKLVHAVYRYSALFRNALEQREFAADPKKE